MIQLPTVALAAIYWVFRGLDEQGVQRQVVTDGVLWNSKQTKHAYSDCSCSGLVAVADGDMCVTILW